ncbi:MAG TPA: hypothetical protein VMG60_12915 [Burkholderiaceae bacterium]|nr:hypothetical protein [Burkholderiaceae bacterium]
MKKILFTLLAAVAAPAFAQASGAGFTQRDINQQERIEQGLKSGSLSTREAGGLEREESHVDKMESSALRDGKVTPAEQARINAAQDKLSRDIGRDRHNGVTGNPNSVSSQRMQADVQRNVNQEQRIQQGMASGQLTNHEAGKLQSGQAHVDHAEAHAARNGHVSGAEQAHVQHAENVQSRHIYRQKHDAQTK